MCGGAVRGPAQKRTVWSYPAVASTTDGFGISEAEAAATGIWAVGGSAAGAGASAAVGSAAVGSEAAAAAAAVPAAETAAAAVGSAVGRVERVGCPSSGLTGCPCPRRLLFQKEG